MEASEAELYFNAMTHYYGFVLSDMLGRSESGHSASLREGSTATAGGVP